MECLEYEVNWDLLQTVWQKSVIIKCTLHRYCDYLSTPNSFLTNICIWFLYILYNVTVSLDYFRVWASKLDQADFQRYHSDNVGFIVEIGLCIFPVNASWSLGTVLVNLPKTDKMVFLFTHTFSWEFPELFVD